MTEPAPMPPEDAAALLRWYAEMGVDEAVETAPANLYSWASAARPTIPPAVASSPSTHVRAEPVAPATPVFTAEGAPPDAAKAILDATAAAQAASSFAELDAALRNFDGCALKAGARNTVFADGVPGADLLVIGEAPGRDEDRIGRPFVGRAGQLIDRMLAAIGRSREENVLISNVIYWRPPGNRTPSDEEAAICRPFVDRLIELVRPKAIMLAGGAPTKAILDVTGIMRARGKWREIKLADGATVPVLPTFHPAFLLRQPQQKRLAWQDLQALEARLRKG